MIGKLKTLSWTDKPTSSRELVFIILILGFGIVLVAKLAPYFTEKSRTVVYNPVNTFQTAPKELTEKVNTPLVTGLSGQKSMKIGAGIPGFGEEGSGKNAPSIIERSLFDGQAVLLRVRSLNSFSSKDPSQPMEVIIVKPVVRQTESDVDFSPSEGAKLVGVGQANMSTKRLHLNFSELTTREGRSYRIQGQAVHPETLTAGIEGEYSSGLPLRLLGIAIDRTIVAADQIGMAHLYSSIGPQGVGAQEFRNAITEVNQQTAENLAAEASKDLRETPAEISLPAGSEFYVRIRALSGGR